MQVLETIRGEFPELKIVMADQLMFVKEDLIIPQHNTFYVSEQLCFFCITKREKHFFDTCGLVVYICYLRRIGTFLTLLLYVISSSDLKFLVYFREDANVTLLLSVADRL